MSSNEPRTFMDPNLEQTFADVTMTAKEDEESFTSEKSASAKKLAGPRMVMDSNLEQTFADVTMTARAVDESFNLREMLFQSAKKSAGPRMVMDSDLEQTFADVTMANASVLVGDESPNATKTPIQLTEKLAGPRMVMDLNLEQTFADVTMANASALVVDESFNATTTTTLAAFQFASPVSANKSGESKVVMDSNLEQTLADATLANFSNSVDNENEIFHSTTESPLATVEVTDESKDNKKFAELEVRFASLLGYCRALQAHLRAVEAERGRQAEDRLAEEERKGAALIALREMAESEQKCHQQAREQLALVESSYATIEHALSECQLKATAAESKCESLLSQLESANQDYRTQIADFEAKLAKSESLLCEQQIQSGIQLEELKGKCASFDEKLEESTRLVGVSQTQLMEAEKSLSDFRAKYELLDALSAESQKKAADAESKCESLLAQLAVSSDCHAKEIASFEAKLEKSDSLLRDNQRQSGIQLEELNGKCAYLEEKLEESTQFAGASQTQLAEAEKSLSVLQEKCLSLEKLSIENQAKATAAESKCESLLSQLESANQDYRTQIADFEAKLAKSESLLCEQQIQSGIQLEKLKGKCASFEEKLEESTRLVGVSQTQLTEAEKSLSDFRAKYELLDALFAENQRKAADAESKCESLSSQLETVNGKHHAEIADFEAKLAKSDSLLRDQQSQFASQLEKLRRTCVALEEKKVALEGQLDAESEEFDEIENNLRAENFDLKTQIVQLKVRLNLISEEQACMELGCDLSKLIEAN